MSDEDTGAPNLDAMPASELEEWAAAVYRRPVNMARKLFPARPRRYVTATKDLKLYAENKAAAMVCRAGGNITSAQIYETICERIYNRLPDFARW